VAETLPPLREVIAKYGLSAKKSLGQNFLLDGNLLDRIVRTAGPLENKTALEIGPGPGGLTRAILAARPARLVAVEKDHRCIDALNELKSHVTVPFDIIEQDALLLEEASLLGQNVEIIANLPYNIGTALLIKWLSTPDWPSWWSGLTLMFQPSGAAMPN
jgi:16S rRNA (adenine1518-N6/adenine1519-N6)-dimethyltransferase